MLSDTEMDDLRWKSELIGGVVPVRPEELRQLLDEIARLRAENEQLRAALAAKTLRADTVGTIRGALAWHGNCGDADSAITDLSRAYPEEV